MAITVPKPQQAHSNCPSGCKEHRRGKYLTIFEFFFHFYFSGDMENDSKRFRTAPHHNAHPSPHQNPHHLTHHHHQYLQSHSGAIMTSQSADLSNHKRAITPLGASTKILFY